VPTLRLKTHTCPPSAVTTTLPPRQKRKKPPRGHQAVSQQSYQAHVAAQSCRMEASEDVLPTACSGADINLREAQPHSKRGVAKNLGFHQWSHKNSNQQDRKIARESHREENTKTGKGSIASKQGVLSTRSWTAIEAAPERSQRALQDPKKRVRFVRPSH
jgi:hypothetical protein